MENIRIANLIIKFRKAALSKQEQSELDDWLRLSEENRRMFERLTDESYLAKLYGIDVRAEQKRIKRLYKLNTGKSFPVTSRRKNIFITVVVIGLGTLLAVWLFRSSVDKMPLPSVAKTEKLPQAENSLIGKEVSLALPNGSTILPDSMQNGDSILCENSYVKKINGKLKITTVDGKYRKNNDHQKSDRLYATLTIPSNRKYQVELTDGSTIWLNELTSFRFPMNFNLNKRDVSLTGEGYFEIKPLLNGVNKVPFVVNAKNMQVNVLGTRFNVNAYKDKREVKTTLIEGAIGIVHGNEVKKMVPGQQASLTLDGALTIKEKSNPQEDIAWLNNKIFYSDAPLQTIMQQVSRWYDVQVSFECCELTRYTFTLDRDKSLSEVLGSMEDLGEFYFVTKGKTIIVKRNR